VIAFWGVVAGLLVLGLAIVVPGLWRPRSGDGSSETRGANVAVYRDQLREAERDLAADLISAERFEQLRSEVQRRVLEDTAGVSDGPAGVADAAGPLPKPARRTAWLLLTLVPVASVATYLMIGRPDALSSLPPKIESGHDVTAAQVQAMVSALATRMKADPGNAEGWQMLSRSYAALGREDDAVQAMRKAAALLPDNVDVMADLADLIAVAQGRKLAGEPARIVAHALTLDPKHIKTLALAGSVAFEARDFPTARTFWERLLALVPPESEMAQSIRAGIAETRQLEAGSGAVAAAPSASGADVGAGAGAAAGAGAGAAGAADAVLTGEVQLSPALAARVAAGDTVFVYARAAQGPRMPLAIVRQPAGAWPLRFTLDDSSAMSPATRLSGATQVVVVARISKSGQAMPQSGDLFGQTEPLPLGRRNLSIVIDQVQP
jgi:cytochrome c-type biogenesis protein CcmH